MIDVNTDEILNIFDSVSDAKRTIRDPYGNISKCAHHGGEYAGYKWEFSILNLI